MPLFPMKSPNRTHKFKKNNWLLVLFLRYIDITIKRRKTKLKKENMWPELGISNTIRHDFTQRSWLLMLSVSCHLEKWVIFNGGCFYHQFLMSFIFLALYLQCYRIPKMHWVVWRKICLQLKTVRRLRSDVCLLYYRSKLNSNAETSYSLFHKT